MNTNPKDRVPQSDDAYIELRRQAYEHRVALDAAWRPPVPPVTVYPRGAAYYSAASDPLRNYRRVHRHITNECLAVLAPIVLRREVPWPVSLPAYGSGKCSQEMVDAYAVSILLGAQFISATAGRTKQLKPVILITYTL